MSLSIRETPQAISVVTRESIEARQSLEGSRDIRIDGFTAGGNRNNFDLVLLARLKGVTA